MLTVQEQESCSTYENFIYFQWKSSHNFLFLVYLIHIQTFNLMLDKLKIPLCKIKDKFISCHISLTIFEKTYTSITPYKIIWDQLGYMYNAIPSIHMERCIWQSEGYSYIELCCDMSYEILLLLRLYTRCFFLLNEIYFDNLVKIIF